MALVCQQTAVPATAILKYEKTLETSLHGERRTVTPPPPQPSSAAPPF